MGKGRQGRIWVSPPGNLYISTLVRLRPGDPPAPTLALVAAVALHEALAARVPGVRIKWPNDLICSPAEAGAQSAPQSALRPLPENGMAKLAGILLERAGDVVVIGFGANLAHHPQGLDRPVTSIAALAGAAPDPAQVAEQLAETFAAWLSRWRTAGLDAIRIAWLAAAHPIGTPLTTPEGHGTFDGLDQSGALRLKRSDNSIRLVHAGDVFLL